MVHRIFKQHRTWWASFFVLLALGLSGCGVVAVRATTASAKLTTQRFLHEFFADHLDQAAAFTVLGNTARARTILRSDFNEMRNYSNLDDLTVSRITWVATCTQATCHIVFHPKVLSSMDLTLHHGRVPIGAMGSWLAS